MGTAWKRKSSGGAELTKRWIACCACLLLLTALGGTVKADRKTYVDATYNAITAKDIRV